MSSSSYYEKQNAFVTLLVEAARLAADAERTSAKSRAALLARYSASARVADLEKELKQARLDAAAAAKTSDKAAEVASAAYTASLKAVGDATESVVAGFTPIPMQHTARIAAFTNAYTAYRQAESEETLAAFTKASAELADALTVA
jgi:hypothetical protein